jgi:capsular exopolysaccharide synthesis family protein
MSAMSRIQHILEKAEREGAPYRIRGLEPVTQAPRPPRSWQEADQPGSDSTTPPIREVAAKRVVTGARLDALLTFASSDHVIAEQYRALRTRVEHAWEPASRVLLITSPEGQEGKSITAANLALWIARDRGRRTCLIDAHMRNPSLSRLFGQPEGPGLCDVLTGRTTLADALVTIEEFQLTILPAGYGAASSADLVSTAETHALIETLRSHFDRVLIDGPPVAPLADVEFLTPRVDGLLLVVRAGVTPKPSIRTALGSLDRSRLLGLVLNESP